MGTTFNFNSYDNSKQNNTIIINNDIDEILNTLKDVSISQDQIDELKIAIQKDEKEVSKSNSLGTNVRNWCVSILNQITSNAIINVSLPILEEQIKKALYAIYHFPIQF